MTYVYLEWMILLYHGEKALHFDWDDDDDDAGFVQ